MAIGNDDLDELDVDSGFNNNSDDIDHDSDLDQPSSKNEDAVDILLREQGIEDKSKIKFENDEGQTEEVNWNDLDADTQLNILSSGNEEEDTGLTNDEINLINSIRQSQLTPAEYLNYAQNIGINQYAQQLQQSIRPQYQVDDISDDELYVIDFMTRTNATEDEAFKALEREKEDLGLYQKQINSIRNEYRATEEESYQLDAYQRQEEAQAQLNQFANNIGYEINNFNDFAGYDLNLDSRDKQEIYEFITGRDPAGYSYLAKALNDPAILTRMAWFVLHGEQMVRDVDDYYKRELTNTRRNRQDSNVVYKQKSNNRTKSNIYDDLDEF